MVDSNESKDQMEHLKYLREVLSSTLEKQEKDLNDQSAKITFLLGFIVTLGGVYLNYGNNLNETLKFITIAFMVLTILPLLLSYKNHVFFRPPTPNTNIYENDEFENRYQEVVNIEKACESNYPIMNFISRNVSISIVLFSISILFLVSSFIF